MIDGHVHLEKGEYCIKWVDEFISYALERGVKEIYFLEHTHIFQECQNLYNEMSMFNTYQSQWYAKKLKNARPIDDYIKFIELMKEWTFPIKIRFGLEVCYSPEHEKDIEKIKEIYPFDFLVGSIHFIDGWAFSHRRQPWKKEDFDLQALYSRYYELMYSLVQSGLFSGLAHPNSLQCFGAYPEGDYSMEYEKIAKGLKRNKMYIEQSSGLVINYGDMELGMNTEMLKFMVKYDIPIITASDAHVPKNVGIALNEAQSLVDEFRAQKNNDQAKGDQP